MSLFQTQSLYFQIFNNIIRTMRTFHFINWTHSIYNTNVISSVFQYKYKQSENLTNTCSNWRTRVSLHMLQIKYYTQRHLNVLTSFGFNENLMISLNRLALLTSLYQSFQTIYIISSKRTCTNILLSLLLLLSYKSPHCVYRR